MDAVNAGNIEDIELAAARFFIDSITRRDQLSQVSILTHQVGADGEFAAHRSPDQAERLAGLVGRAVASVRQAGVCGDEVQSTCRIPPSHAVLALGEVLVDGDRAEIAVWSWRGTSSSRYPLQRLVDHVTLQKSEGGWRVTGIRITRMT